MKEKNGTQTQAHQTASIKTRLALAVLIIAGIFAGFYFVVMVGQSIAALSQKMATEKVENNWQVINK